MLLWVQSYEKPLFIVSFTLVFTIFLREELNEIDNASMKLNV